MSENGHTKGPWRVNKWGGLGCGETGMEPTVVYGDAFPGVRSVATANRRLISAAPDLLEALQEVMAEIDVLLDRGDLSSFDAEEKARAAIRRATEG